MGLRLCPLSASSFEQAKGVAAKLFGSSGRTFYCGCRYSASKVFLSDCLARLPEEVRHLPAKLEWEHIIPASEIRHAIEVSMKPKRLLEFLRDRNQLLRGLPNHTSNQIERGSFFKALYRNLCPKLSRRQCAKRVLPLYKDAEGDLHNLVPSLSSINRLRSNRRYGSHLGSRLGVRMCWAYLTSSHIFVDDRLKGFVARTHLYFEKKHRFYRLSTEQRKSYTRWSQQFREDLWEKTHRTLLRRVERSQARF